MTGLFLLQSVSALNFGRSENAIDSEGTKHLKKNTESIIFSFLQQHVRMLIVSLYVVVATVEM